MITRGTKIAWERIYSNNKLSTINSTRSVL